MDLARATLRWLNDQSPQGILIADAGLTIRGWNHWLEMCSGRPAAEMVGRNLLEAYPELADRGLDQFFRQALAGQAVMLSQHFHGYLLPMPVQGRRAGFSQMQQAARIAPLLEDGRVIGAIAVIEDVTERLVREEELKRQIAVQDALHEIDRAILALELDECLQRVVSKSAALVGAALAAVVLREGADLRLAACFDGRGASEGVPCAQDWLAGGCDTVAAWAANTRQAILLPDVQAAAKGAARPLDPRSRSVVAAPLVVEDQVIGALVVESPRPEAFTETEQDLIIALATQAAVGIHNARLYTAARESEEKFRRVAETAASAIFIYQGEKFRYVNAAAQAISGYSEAELLAMRFWELVHGDHRELVRERGLRRQRGEAIPARYEFKIVAKNGEERWLDFTAGVIEYQGQPASLGTAFDITERKRMEEAEREQRRLAEALRDAAAALSSTLSREEVLDRILDEVRQVAPYDTANIMTMEDSTARVTRCLGYTERAAQVALARRFSVSEVANLRQMAEGGRPCIVPDTAAYSGWIPAPSVEGIRSYAGAPIRSKGRVLGFLNLNSATAGFFTETHAARLQAFADQAAVALDNARLFDDAVRSAGRTQALYETGRALAALLEEDAVLRTILEAAHRTLGYQYAVISLVDESSQTIGIRHGIWDGQLDAFPGWIEASRYPLSASDILCDICRTGRTEIIAAWDDRFNRDIWERFGHERLLRVFMSIKVRDRVVGVIEAGYDRSTKSSLGEDEVRLLAAFVDQAAAALDNARLFHDVQHRSDELAALLEVTRDLAAHQELPAVLRSIVGHACRLLNTPTGHIYLHDEATGELVLASEIGLPDRQGVRLQPGEGMAGQTAQMRQSLVVDDYRVWPGRSAQFADRPVTSVAQVPLLFGGRLVGILGVGELAPATRRFTEENVRLLTLLAGHAASAVHNARLYDQVRRHADELEARVAQRTAELQAANEKLEELNRYKSQFVSNVSHELRTPLTNIKFLLELLVTGKPEKRQYYLETVVRETDLLHSLIEDLLLLSRMDLGRLQLELQAVELNQLAGQLAADRTALFAERGLALETRLAPNLPRVKADPRMVKQVLTNLMTNAMNYTPAGGAVTVSTGFQIADCGLPIADLRLQIPNTPNLESQISNPKSTWVTLSVRDTGPGISDKELARLFERFFRGAAAHQSKAPGTGLGLAICQEIAQRHRGQITVESQVGVGSVFTLWLPVG